MCNCEQYSFSPETRATWTQSPQKLKQNQRNNNNNIKTTAAATATTSLKRRLERKSMK